VQLAKGFAPDLALYAQGLVVLAVPLVPLIVLALFFQALTNHKLIGLLLMVLVLLTRFALPQLGFENNLALYGSHPPITYTAQGGYGHHAEPFGWFMLYWGLAAVALATATLMLWPRGTQGPLRERLAVARGRLSRPALATTPLVMMSLALLGMAATGGWIYVNTNLRNEYLDRDRIPQKLADYERQYAEYRDLPLPRVTRVFTEVDLFPETRRAELRGRFSLENQGAVPVQLLPISISPRWVEGVLPVYGGVTLEAVELPEHRVVLRDDELGFHLYELERPLAPGEAFELGFTVRVDHSAFANRRHNNLLVENGTFFSNANFLPTVGYARSNQMRNPTERRKRGLPEIARVADLDDADAHQRNYLEADWIAFEAILSTPADQIALASGNLEREWTEGDRRYFHYKTHAPITNLLPFLSGRYEVARDRWQHVDIEVYYHPDHAFNVERFSSVTRHSLEYMTRHFGPYAHDQLRIVEIPRYHGQVAFAFAQTIPFSESWCFTANVEAAELDWLSAIHAHEVSHQWWNHQVIPADVQGATLISEALAQYSSMMILEEIYGEEEVRRFLRHHLDRYLVGRGNERVREMPLARVENQDYIHYGKGSLALYALEDAIGEARLNRALRAFIDAFAYQGPPYPTSRDLLAHLRQEVPAEHQGLLEDLFETITLYDNRILSATAEPQDDGSYRVTLETQTVKLRDDGHGHTTELGVDESIEFGVFGEPLEGRETVLALEKRHVRDARQTGSRASTFTFVVDERPVRAGIDPYHKLIDRDADDNLLAVKVLSPRR
ncbi:MAG: M1 family aminopeptidase, partial [Acidobacteriota bacterium]